MKHGQQKKRKIEEKEQNEKSDFESLRLGLVFAKKNEKRDLVSRDGEP